MSRHSGGLPVRYRRVIWAAGMAGSLMVASAASAAWRAASMDDPTADEPILQVAKVSSKTTGTEVTITVRTPERQPPGVTYTVTRSTARGDSVVCKGAAPLVCRDRVGVAGTSVSYTVVSTLDGHGQAVIAVDASTAPRPTTTSRPPTTDAGPASSSEHEDPRSSESSTTHPESPSPSPSASPSPSGSPTGSPSPTGSTTPSPDAGSPTPSGSGSATSSASGSPSAGTLGHTSSPSPTEVIASPTTATGSD